MKNGEIDRKSHHTVGVPVRKSLFFNRRIFIFYWRIIEESSFSIEESSRSNWPADPRRERHPPPPARPVRAGRRTVWRGGWPPEQTWCVRPPVTQIINSRGTNLHVLLKNLYFYRPPRAWTLTPRRLRRPHLQRRRGPFQWRIIILYHKNTRFLLKNLQYLLMKNAKLTCNGGEDLLRGFETGRLHLNYHLH